MSLIQKNRLGLTALSLVFVGGLCSCSPTESPHSAQPGQAEDLFKTHRESIVRIHTMNKDGTKARSGTGFAIRNGNVLEIVTNKHITEDQDVIIIESEQGSWLSSKRKEHTSKDICIIEVEAGIEIKPINIDPSYAINPGQRVFTIGHPLGFDIAIYEGMINSLNKGKVVFSAPLSEGASGSPLLTPEGKVIGICDSYVAGVGAQNYNLATPLREGWNEEGYKTQTSPVDPYLANYLGKISAVRKKIRGSIKELEELSKNDNEFKEWVEKTQWTRELFQESAENACISFSAVDWANIGQVKELDLRKKEAALLISSGLSLRESWEAHKKKINSSPPPKKGGGFIGMKESETFVANMETVGHKLNQLLDSAVNSKMNTTTPKKSQVTTQQAEVLETPLTKELIIALGEYKIAERRFFELGIP